MLQDLEERYGTAGPQYKDPRAGNPNTQGEKTQKSKTRTNRVLGFETYFSDYGADNDEVDCLQHLGRNQAGKLPTICEEPEQRSLYLFPVFTASHRVRFHRLNARDGKKGVHDEYPVIFLSSIIEEHGGSLEEASERRNEAIRCESKVWYKQIFSL